MICSSWEELDQRRGRMCKYNFIIMRLKTGWTGLICHTQQHYHRQWLPTNTEWSHSRRWAWPADRKNTDACLQIASVRPVIIHGRRVQVAWLDHGSIPLTYEERRIVDDARFTVVRPYSKEWNLQIRNIQREDQGQYRCTINTSPVKSKVIMLYVKGSFKCFSFVEFYPNLTTLRSGLCYRTSVCRLYSVTFVRHTQGVETFGNISPPFCTLAITWPPYKIVRSLRRGR